MRDLFLMILIIAIPLLADFKVRSSYRKYLKVKAYKGLSGQEVARQILDKNGLEDVYVVATPGLLSDHYDPSRKTVRLSQAVFEGESVASLAIAAHECGHAIQDKNNYWFMRLRAFIFPIVNITSSLSYYIIVIGLFLEALNLFYLGIGLACFGLLFHLITLPVEFDASKRAKNELKDLKVVNASEEQGVNSVLSSAAMTYVAGVLTQALQILRFVLMVRDND